MASLPMLLLLLLLLLLQVPTDVSSRQGATLLTHDLFTNNVVYMEAVMDMKSVPMNLLPLVPLFCRSLTNMATEVCLRACMAACACCTWHLLSGARTYEPARVRSSPLCLQALSIGTAGVDCAHRLGMHMQRA